MGRVQDRGLAVGGATSEYESRRLSALGWFRVVCILVFLVALLGRTLYLRFTRGIRVLTLGVGKRGFEQLVEIAFFVGLVV